MTQAEAFAHCCSRLGFSEAEILGPRRIAPYAAARKVIAYVLYSRLPEGLRSYTLVAKTMRRDRSTVSHLARQVPLQAELAAWAQELLNEVR